MSERETIRSMVAEAATIAVPSGRDYAKCIYALREECDIDVPDFPDRVLTVRTNGQTWKMAKGKDVPARVARGFAQVGLTGTDVLLNQPDTVTAECLRFDEAGEEIRFSGGSRMGPNLSNVRSRYWPLGQKMCQFSLLGTAGRCDELRDILSDTSAEPVEVVTGLPVLLKRLRYPGNFRLSDEAISGSVEGAVDWLAPMVADLVEKGNTRRANKLEEIEVLTDIFPAVFRCETAPYIEIPPYIFDVTER